MSATWFPGNRNMLRKVKQHVQAPLASAPHFSIRKLRDSTMPKCMQKQYADHNAAVKSSPEIVKKAKVFSMPSHAKKIGIARNRANCWAEPVDPLENAQLPPEKP